MQQFECEDMSRAAQRVGAERFMERAFFCIAQRGRT
jgi:hypothetical protein